MSALSIYFGPKSINIVETKGNNIAKSIQIPHSSFFKYDLSEKVPTEVKAIELGALIRDELRKNNISAKEMNVCLCGQDLIVRTFEIPVMPKQELQNAVMFEAKKYVPFKMEELTSDFQVQFDKANRTNLVLFAGIKNDILKKYVDILGQSGVKLSSIQYSAFSLAKGLKLMNISEKGIIGVLGVDANAEDECNFVVLEDGFPIFARDIPLSMGAEEKEVVPGEIIEKIKTEMRISIDYYNRKFPEKAIKKIYLVSEQDHSLELGILMKEIGLSLECIDLTKKLGKAASVSLNTIKAYASSLPIKTNVKINLLEKKEKISVASTALGQKGPTVSFKNLFDSRVVVLGVLFCAAIWAVGFYRQQPLNKRLNELINSRPKVSSVDPNLPNESLLESDSQYKKRVDALDALIKKQLYSTYPLNIIPTAVPKGMWLTSFDLNGTEAENRKIDIEGFVYLSNSEEEFQRVNDFVANLKNSQDFSKYFKEVKVVSIERTEHKKVNVTKFAVEGSNK